MTATSPIEDNLLQQPVLTVLTKENHDDTSPEACAIDSQSCEGRESAEKCTSHVQITGPTDSSPTRAMLRDKLRSRKDLLESPAFKRYLHYAKFWKADERERELNGRLPASKIETVGQNSDAVCEPQVNECDRSRWQVCYDSLPRWVQAYVWKFRRIRLELELQPARIQQFTELSRRFNKIGALVYGPFAFVAGITFYAGGNFKWLLLIPGIWFIGMVLSHAIFDKCVLNVMTAKLRTVNRQCLRKSRMYNNGTDDWSRDYLRDIPDRITCEEIEDDADIPEVQIPNENTNPNP